MAGLSLIEIIYWGSTVIGGTLFFLSTIMMFIGGGLSDDALDTAMHSDIHMDADASNHTDADSSFKLLSLQGLTAFFMMFGLVGLALLRAGLPALVTVLGGALAGTLTVWVIGMIFNRMKLLQSDGTIQLNNAIGTEGVVYLTIPKNGTGQVQIVVQGALKVFDAISNSKAPLPTGDKVRVAGVANEKTLIVEKA
jgi:membrane protein implicated in regulation of membrane protease activity